MLTPNSLPGQRRRPLPAMTKIILSVTISTGRKVSSIAGTITLIAGITVPGIRQRHGARASIAGIAGTTLITEIFTVTIMIPGAVLLETPTTTGPAGPAP